MKMKCKKVGKNKYGIYCYFGKQGTGKTLFTKKTKEL